MMSKKIIFLFLLLLPNICISDFCPTCEDKVHKFLYPQKRLIKILSIDGGGIRGIIPIIILKNIESRLKKKKSISQCFDVMAGTSTGAIIVLMLNVPTYFGKPRYNPEQILNLYKTLGDTIFFQSFFRWFFTFNGWFSEKYSSEYLEETMKDWLGDIRLRDSITNILIPAYDIGNHKALFFRKIKAQIDLGKDFFMRDIGRASCAAPTYFEPANIESIGGRFSYTLIDGGIAVNNPSISACVHAIEIYGKNNDFLVVSLGTGSHYEPENRNFLENTNVFKGGNLQWADKIIDLLIYASSDTIHYQLLQLLNVSKNYYFRFQPIIDISNKDMDDVSPENIDSLEKYAYEIISTQDKQLEELAKILDSE